MQAQSCEAETEGRSWSTSTVVRKFRSGQRGVFEPKSPIKGGPHFKAKGFRWFPSCTQSLPESSPWKARPWSKCCAGRHGDKGRDGEKCREEKIVICEMNHQSRFNAWYGMLGAGALGWPRGMGWGGRWWGFRMGNTWTPMADSCQCMAKPIQYCKVNK